MKQVMAWIFIVALLIEWHDIYAEEPSYKKEVPITRDLSKAKEIARAYRKPLALIFTGSDWCPYSKKLLKEVIKSDTFAQEVHKELLFVNLDFPELNPHPDTKLVEQNYQVKAELQVHEFPLIVVLDADFHEIIRMGFSGLTSAEYGRHLTGAVKKYNTIKAAIESKKVIPFSDLKNKYLEARELGSSFLTNALLNMGLKQDQDCFFHLEKYRITADDMERETWKKKILALSQDSKNQVALHLAILEYQEQRRQHKADALQPLLEYAQGVHVSENIESWRVHMLIAQHLATEGCIAQAREHVELSLALAPEEHRDEIKCSLKLLSADLIAKQQVY